MKRILGILLAFYIIITVSACRQEEQAIAQSMETQSVSQNDILNESPESEDPDAPVEVPPDEPMEEQVVEEVPFPGEPVFVEIETEAWAAAIRAAENVPEDEPVEMILQRPTVFDHYNDPPSEGTVRLVYVYNYGENKVLTVENEAEISKILEIVDTFKVSDYNSGSLLGGEVLVIQVVRDGVHQWYAVFRYDVNGGYLASNNREAEKWYETGKENLEFLMGYFGNSQNN